MTVYETNLNKNGKSVREGYAEINSMPPAGNYHEFSGKKEQSPLI